MGGWTVPLYFFMEWRKNQVIKKAAIEVEKKMQEVEQQKRRSAALTNHLYHPDGQIWCLDHIVPRSKGGPSLPGCAACNAEKYDKSVIQFIRDNERKRIWESQNSRSKSGRTKGGNT